MFDLTDKVVVITGGAGKLGQKHAEAVAEFKAVPILLDLSLEQAKIVATRISKEYGVMTCFKAHYNTCIDNTELCLKAIKQINHPSMGLDFDPSHIYRVPEDPVKGLNEVMPWIKHIHFRDCVAPDITGPGMPQEQICGRGKIDLKALINILQENKYTGPLVLECIGTKAKNLSLETCTIIAAETKGWINAVIN